MTPAWEATTAATVEKTAALAEKRRAAPPVLVLGSPAWAAPAAPAAEREELPDLKRVLQAEPGAERAALRAPLESVARAQAVRVPVAQALVVQVQVPVAQVPVVRVPVVRAPVVRAPVVPQAARERAAVVERARADAG